MEKISELGNNLNEFGMMPMEGNGQMGNPLNGGMEEPPEKPDGDNGEEPPEKCPICGAPSDVFVKQ